MERTRVHGVDLLIAVLTLILLAVTVRAMHQPSYLESQDVTSTTAPHS